MRIDRIVGAGIVLLSLGVGVARSAPRLAVLQIGDGITAYSLNGQPIRIDYFDPSTSSQAAPLSATIVPSSGSNELVIGGGQTEGQLVTAPNGDLVFGGYHVPAGTNNPAGGSSLGGPRVIATVNGANYAQVASFGSVGGGIDYSSRALSSGATDSNGHFWGAASNDGTILARGGSNNVVVQSSKTSTRVISVINGNLYFSSLTTPRGIYSLGPAGSATSAGMSPALVIATGTGSIPNDFAINADETIAYVADDRVDQFNLHTGAGVQRYDKVNRSWSLSYTLEIDPITGNTPALGLGVDWSGADPIVYASTDDRLIGVASKIVRWIDTGPASSHSTLATAPTNTAFRGVEFVVPEPSSLGLIGFAACTFMCRRRAR